MSAHVVACTRCGQQHRQRADWLACDAIHGYRRAYPAGVRTPMCLCELCGAAAPLDELLEHFFYEHRHERVTTGLLVRFVLDVHDVGSYRDEEA